jgi:hypothetical protein
MLDAAISQAHRDHTTITNIGDLLGIDPHYLRTPSPLW